MTKEMIARINALAKKKREQGLTPAEQEEQRQLYAAYLADLKLAHTVPIIVAEFGIPTSRGMGHESVMGYNQGKVDEKDQGKMLIDMLG